MNNQQLIKKVGDYLNDYLLSFVEEEMTSDVRLIGENSFESMCNPPSVIDIHKTRFDNFYQGLPSTNLRLLIEKVKTINDLVVIDLGSFYGETFGLFVAQEKPEAEVHIYNPQTMPFKKFGDLLFNDWNKDKIAKLSKKTDFNPDFQEESTNQLYLANRLENITYHKDFATEDTFLKHVQEGKKVVIFSDRTPSMPLEMTSRISEFVANNENADMLLMPILNSKINAYQGNEVINLLSKHYKRFYNDEDSKRKVLPNSSARSRLRIASSLYYSLLSANQAGGSIYRREEASTEKGFPFHNTLFYSTTIKP